MGRYLYSPLVVEALLCIFLFFLPILEAGKEDTSHFHDGLDHNFPLDGSVEDEELVIEDGPNEATKEFRSNVHFDNTLTNGGVLDLDELSECIRAGQDKSTLERWMECIKSEGSHTMDSQGILPSSANEILSVDEEKGTEFSNLHEQIENDNREALGALDASLLLSGLQNSSAEFMDSTGTQLTKVSKNDEQEEQKIYPQTVEHHESEPDEFVGMIGSVINDNSVDTELPSLEEVEPEKLNSEDSKPRDPEMLFSEEAKCDVPNTEISESGVPYKLRKLLQELLGYLSRNTKLFAFFLSSLLLLLGGLSMRILEKSMMIIQILTEAKQRAVVEITEFFGSKESGNMTKLPNEKEKVEHVVSSQKDQLVGALGSPLGMAIATVFAEILESNHQKEQYISADELSRVMGLAVKESLFQVIDTGCQHFANDFEASFRSTLKTIRLVRQTYHDKERTFSNAPRKQMSSSQRQTAGNASSSLTTDVGVLDTEMGCTEASNYEESHKPSITGKCQVESDKLTHMHRNSVCCDTANEHKMKVEFEKTLRTFEHEFCNKPSCMRSDPQACLRFSESHINHQYQASKESRQFAGNDCLSSGMTGVGNAYHNNFSYVKSEVNITGENHHTSHLNSDSGVHYGEIEGSSRDVEDVVVQAVHSPNPFVGNSSFESPESTATTAMRTGENDACKLRDIHSTKETSSLSENYQQVVLHEHCQHKEQSDRQLMRFVGSMPEATALALLSEKSLSDAEFHKNFLNVLDKSVREKERRNDLKSLEIMQKLRHFRLEEEQLHVNSESNELMRHRLDLNHSKALFKESVFVDQKLNKAYVELSKKCADDLAAGLILMLLALAYGIWRYSHARLSEAISVCQLSTKEPRKSSWFYNPMDSVTGHFQTLACGITVVSRMLAGIFAVAAIAYSLLRQTVASSSQTMPATVIIIVLGGVCGWAGKLSVDSLGGNGFHWLLLWEVLCILHAFANCFTSYLVRILNGPTSGSVGFNLIPVWIRNFAFHTILAFVLPVMAGLTPFAPVMDWTKHFSTILLDQVFEPVSASLRDGLRYFLEVYF